MYIVFRSAPVQTWLVHKASNWLSSELGTKVWVNKVDVDFFKTAVLEGVYIEDELKDTMFYFRKLKVDYKNYDKYNHLINLNSLTIEDGKIFMGYHKNQKISNYQFFFDFLNGGPKDPNKPKIIWKIFSKEVYLYDTRFSYFNKNLPTPDFLDFNYNDFSFYDINAKIKDFSIVDDSIAFNALRFSTIEKCGFEVKKLSAFMKMSKNGIEFNNMRLRTEKSDIRDYLKLETTSWKDYSDYVNKVKMIGRLNNAKVHTDDLAFFTNNLKPYHTLIKMTGEGSGLLSYLKGKNTSCELLSKTHLKGDWSLQGLPNFKNTILNFDLEKLETNYEDLKIITSNNVPENFATLGQINFKGQFTGFYNDFITYGDLSTMLGDFKTDLNFKFKEGLEKGTYSGVLKTSHFQLNKFFKAAPIDELGFDLKIVGKGMTKETFDINIEGAINELLYNNYKYTNIKTISRIKKDLFSGFFDIKDPNFDLTFNGDFTTINGVPSAKFKTHISTLNIAKLGFDSIDQIIKGDIDIDFVGVSIDDAQGKIVGKNIHLERNNSEVFIPDLSIIFSEINKERNIELRSEPLDLNIYGDYKLSLLASSVQNFAHVLLPAFVKKPLVNLTKEFVNFDINLKSPNDLTALYFPDLKLKPMKLFASYNSENNSLNLIGFNELINYKDFEIQKLKVNASKEPNSELKLTILADKFTNLKNFNTENIVLNAKIEENTINFDLKASDTTFNLNLATFGQFYFQNDSVYLTFKESNINLGVDTWILANKSKTTFTKGNIHLENFTLFNKEQSIVVNGDYGEKSQENLILKLKDFDLKTINNFIKGNSIPKTNGVSNGTIVFNSKNNSKTFESDFEIKQFAMNKDTFGNLSIKTQNNGLNAPQKVKLEVLDGLLDSLKIEGTIDYISKKNNFNLAAFLPKTKAAVFEPFLKGVLTNMKGSVYTKDSIKIFGSFNEPIVEGEIILDNMEVVIDYLNVPVHFSTKVKCKKNSFEIMPFTLFDNRKQTAKANGSISHTGFKDYVFNFNLNDIDNFHVLNTKQKASSLYYGQGYVSGNASFNGPFTKLDIKMNMKTMPNTNFFLPISEGVASDLPSFVHFKIPRKKFIKKVSDFPINSLIMDVEATQDANVEIIFDETLGDKISGNGNGNIRMEMNSIGDFYMFGTYKVAQGKYLFTAFDIYNKPFLIRPGGTISWYGDPLDAKLDIVAYNLSRANSQPLQLAVAANATSGSAKIVTVESELYLKGNLFSPEITFGLNFPKLQLELQQDYITLQSVISRIKSDKDEVSRQIFGLLIINSFLPPTFAEAGAGSNNIGTTALSTAGSDLLSAQLSNWLNKIDPNWRVNVIYKNGTFALPPEYGVELSSKFLKDKLTFDGSISSLTNRPNINLEYKITSKGNIKVKAYTRSSFSQTNAALTTPITTTGVGIVYTKEFNYLGIFRRKKKKK